MKKKIVLFSIMLTVLAVTVTSLAQKGKENKGNDKEQQQGNGKKNKENGRETGKHNDKDKDKDKGNGREHGNDDGKKEKNSKNDNEGVKNKMKDGFKWDRETFKDRKDIRKNIGKVTICHKPGRNNRPGVTISVSGNALKAHLGHGDAEGVCPAVTNTGFSNTFLERRTDYYTGLQNSQEQVLYSRSILDYALERLTGARSQLVVLQNNNAPAADIERKRLLVTDLEQNVSLLQTLIGVTANIIADRLMN